MRTIKVQGKGEVSKSADWVTIHFDVKTNNLVYHKALTLLNEYTDDLRKRIEAVGHSRKEIKTREFSIEASHHYDKSVKIFDGYIASHRLEISFDLDQKEVNAVFQEVSKSLATPTIDIRFSVKDSSSFQQEVLSQAVKVAMLNAKTIAKASGIKLGEIQSIDYGWTQIRISEQDYSFDSMSDSVLRSPVPNIEPADVSAADTVTLVYEIKP